MTTVTARCPQCQKPSLISRENTYRPFCSKRCKLIDLGEWFSDRYGLPAESQEGPENDFSDSLPSDSPIRHQ
jgi:uncharacterized protein